MGMSSAVVAGAGCQALLVCAVGIDHKNLLMQFVTLDDFQ